MSASGATQPIIEIVVPKDKVSDKTPVIAGPMNMPKAYTDWKIPIARPFRLLSTSETANPINNGYPAPIPIPAKNWKSKSVGTF